MFRNAVRATLLDLDLYNEAERTPAMVRQAAVIVVLANALAGIGTWFGVKNVFGSEVWDGVRSWLGVASWPVPAASGLAATALGGVASALIGWVVWAALTNVIGTRVVKGTTDFGEMIRVLGFAQAPRALGVIPLLGPVAAVWTLVASVVAVREGLDVSTFKAVATVSLGWAVWFLLVLAFAVLAAVTF